jgi:dihydrodipicolinate synthase/N-acetylneuraminate lyase
MRQISRRNLMQRDKQASLKGIFNITMTPFAADGSIDYPALARSIERVVGLGYDGLLIGGAYGEFPTMSPQERAELFRCSIEYGAGKVPVMLCTAASDPRVTLELTQLASALGVYAIVTVPYVSEVQEHHILEYFRWIAPAARSGLIIYNAPGIGITLTASLVEQLSEIDNVVGLKQGDLDPTVIDRIANRLSGKLRLFCASDLAFLGPIMAGFDGLSSTNSCAFPELILATYRAVRSGDTRSAIDLHRSWFAFRELASLRPAADRQGRHGTSRLGKRSRPFAVATAHVSATQRGGRSDRRHPRRRPRSAQSRGVIFLSSFHSNVARIHPHG